MAVYDDQKEGSEVAHHDDMGVHPERREAEVAGLEKAYSADAIDDAERNTGDTQKDEAEQEESDKLGKGFTENSSGGSRLGNLGKKLRGFSSKKKTAGGIIGVLMLGGGFAGFSILQGPMQAVHFAQYLSRMHFAMGEDFGDNRVGKLFQYARTTDEKQRRNMGMVGNAVADHYEKKLKAVGITPDYDNSRRIKALVVDPETPAGKHALAQFGDEGRGALSDAGDGKIRINLDYGGVGSARYRRLAISSMVDTMELGKVSTALGSRVLKVRAGVDFHPLKNIAKSADEDIKDYVKKRKEERKQRIKNGVSPVAGDTATAAGGEDAEGNATEPTDGDKAGAEEIEDLIGNVDENASVEDRAAHVRNQLTAGFGVTGFVAMICGVQQLGDAAEDIRYANVILPLIRTGMEAITVGFQVMSGQDVNMDELNALSDGFYNEETGTSWTQAATVQANMGQEVTGPDIPEGTHPEGDIKGAGFFAKVDKFISFVPEGKTVCKAVNSTIGGWVLSGIGAAISAGGPLAFLTNLAADRAQEFVLSTFIDDIIAWLAGDQVDILAQGALYGSYADYGARLAANDVARSDGGFALSKEQEASLRYEVEAIARIENQNKPFYERYLSFNNYDSLASRLAMTHLYRVNTSSASNTVASTMGIFGSLVRGVGSSLVGNRASAATANYGFPAVGMPLDVIDSEKYANPYENADKVVPHLEDYNEKWGIPCFGAYIDPETKAYHMSGSAINPNTLPDECKDTSETFIRYALYLGDIKKLAAMDCYEEDLNAFGDGRDTCTEIGLTNTTVGSSTDAPDEPLAEGAEGWVWPVKDGAAVRPGPCWGGPRVHAGMDINVSKTNVKVYAMHNGEVVSVSQPYSSNISDPGGSSPAGNNVIVKADNGMYYWYQHLQPGIKVTKGQKVAAGVTEIGLVGKTGNVVLGSSVGHLHIVLATSSNMGSYGNLADSVNPMNYLPKAAPGGYRCYVS